MFSLRFLKFSMVADFYRIIHAMKEAQNMGLTNVVWLGLNVVLLWFVLRLLLRLMFCECFVINRILVLITIGKSSLELLIFFVKEIHVLIS